jgi:NADP-dependent aldehyde dehydrogenase
MDLRIDTAVPQSNPPRPDLRKTMTPLGPVVVFGAANFPFAYSTAGGDTACALAAGCPVIVKAHPAHAETSELVAQAILVAQRNETCQREYFIIFMEKVSRWKRPGDALQYRAVGFTGSFAGGNNCLIGQINARSQYPFSRK